MLEQDKSEVAPVRKVTRDVTYCAHSRFNKPTLTVSPGETFVAETELCSGDWLKSIDDRWEPSLGFGPNPTVVVEIEGAQPGDMLAVAIDDVQPDQLGYTGFAPGETPFPDWIRRVEWGVVTMKCAQHRAINCLRLFSITNRKVSWLRAKIQKAERRSLSRYQK